MPGWTWIAASRCGTSHAQNGERRQDAYRVVSAAPGILIAVACDGAGSARYGRHGAALAARVLSTHAERWVARHAAVPGPAVIELWIAEVRSKIVATADRKDCVPADFATTLVMAITDGRSTIVAHVGDGAVVAREAGSASPITLSWPHSGEYAATTFFLTDAVLHLRIGVLDHLPIDRIALFTDGLERLALDFTTQQPHSPFFETMFAAVTPRLNPGRNTARSRQLGDFLDSDAVTSRTDDDKTFILAAVG